MGVWQVSVVIPVLNAAAMLPVCLGALRVGGDAIGEIIVVDGGSTDGSPALAEALGAKVLQAPAGRGGQLRAGVAVSQHETLLLLHADTVLSANWPVAAAAADPGKAGYFRYRLDTRRRMARVLERMVRLRCRVLALPYGDQGLLIHRDLLTAVGGVPDLPLMEDVVLARRLRRNRLRLLEADAVTSAARYERDGFLRRPLRNACCLGLFLAGAPIGFIRKLYG